MIASSSVVLANLAYLLGAVVVAVISGTFVWLRHRQPKSVDANVSAFNRGLRALAPDSVPAEVPGAGAGAGGGTGVGAGSGSGANRPPHIEPGPRGLRVIRTEIDLSEGHDPVNGDPVNGDPVNGDPVNGQAGAEEATGERAGAESG